MLKAQVLLAGRLHYSFKMYYYKSGFEIDSYKFIYNDFYYYSFKNPILSQIELFVFEISEEEFLKAKRVLILK